MDVVVPIKRFSLAKQRLAPLVLPRQRADLARAMAEHVLAALRRVEQVGRILIVSDEPTMLGIAKTAGCGLLADNGGGLNTAIAHALTELPAESEVGIIHADLPLLSARAFARLVAEHRRRPGPRITLATDVARTGTNVLLCSRVAALTPCFGPNSADRHRAMAAAAGLDAVTVRSAALSRDCDTPEDLVFLADRVSGDTALGAALRAAFPRPRGRRIHNIYERPLT